MRGRTLPLMLAGAAAFVALFRLASGRRVQSATAHLHPGADGIVPGAHSIELSGDRAGAVLLLHGFGDTPQSLDRLARYLHRHGWSVSVPLLPGHGRSLREFGESGAEEWVGAAREALDRLRERRQPVFLLGQSMGGAIATTLAAESKDVAGLVLLAPYLGMPSALRWLARSHPVWSVLSPWVASRSERSILDPAAREASLGYGALAPHLLEELLELSERARKAAAEVQAPVLALYSRQDHRVSPVEAERGFAALGTREKWMVWMEGSGHVLSVDFDHERLFRLVGRWLARRGASRVPSSSP